MVCGSFPGRWAFIIILEAVSFNFITSGQILSDNVAHKSQVRRHGDIDTGKLVQDDFDTGSNIALRNTAGASIVARISPYGTFAKEGNFSLSESMQSNGVLVTKYGTSEKVATSKVMRPRFPDSRTARIVQSHTKPHSIWRVALLAKRAWRQTSEKVPLAASTKNTITVSDLRNWTLSFFLSLLFLGLVSTYVGGKFKADPQPDDDLVAVRGRACWTYCCGGSVLLLSLLTFFVTLSALSFAKPHSADVNAGPKHPGERAFEAGEGVALSVAFFAFIILRRRHAASLQISSGLISQFAIRGATLSVIVATILELSGIFGMNYLSGIAVRKLVPSDRSQTGGPGMILVAALMMGIVGLAEELSKAVALVCGTWINALALRGSQPMWYARPWRLLVESPRGIMLAGLSVGCGFMTMENVGYLLSTGLMYDKNDSAMAERIVRCVIVSVRVGLNLHPWLAGITSARIARVCFGDGRSTLSLSFSELAWALAPSVVLHALFDFSLLVLPGLLAMFLPMIFFCTARWLFDKEWTAFEERALEPIDPVEDTISAQDS
jgi:RsiW-degrading membrane proteinase PrsW (M82 family)